MNRTRFMARPDSCRRSWRRRSAVSGPALAVADWNLQPPVTPIARQMYDLHYFIFWICVVIFVAVFGVMFYSLFRHRKSLGHQSAHFHENTIVEIVWTVIPFLILLFMAFPATKTILAMKDTQRAGTHDQGHRQPVELELRLSAGGLRLLLQPVHAGGADREPRAQGRALPARGGQPAGRAGRHQGARPRHRRRRASTRGGCPRSASSRTPSPASSATRGSRPRRPASIAASAPSSAARDTASCRSSSR